MLSKKTKYGIKALTFLARRENNDPVAISEIAQSENISIKFLESILLLLRNSGFLGAKKGKGGGYYLKLDVESFFRSINKDILYNLVEKSIEDDMNGYLYDKEWQGDVLWLIKKIIFHKPTENYIYRGRLELQKLISQSKSLFYSGDKGLPIGNLTSQFFANIYLNELDHFIKDELKIESM